MFKRLKPCLLYNEAKIINDYQQAWRYQKVLTEHAGVERKKGNFVPDSMILVQHQSLYTLGRGATLDNLKFAPNEPGCLHKVYRVERGGEVTWHGPGSTRELYTNSLEQVVIDALNILHIKGERSKVNTGVWVGKNKICAIGVTATRWVTMHGLALNIHPDLSNYNRIIPCGIKEEGHSVCSVHSIDSSIEFDAVLEAFLSSFSNIFEVEFEERSFKSLKDTVDSYPEISSATLDRKL